MSDEFSHEFRELKKKQFVEEKRRQQLRENNQELREIAKHIRTAYFVKSLKDQQQQLEAKKQEECQLKHKETLEIEEQIRRNEELQRQIAIQEEEKKEKTRNMLKDQIKESLQRRQENIEELTIDRDRLDKVLKNLKLEEANQQREEEGRKAALKQELESFMQQQELHKLKTLQLDEEERKRAEDIQRQRDEDMRRIKEQKRRERAKQEALSEKIGLDVYKKEMEKRRREELMLELLEHERKAREDYCFRENLERQVRARERVRFELEKYIEKRKIEKEQEKRNKLSTERAEMDRLIAENEKKSALEIQLLREKEQAYNSSIQEMLEERRKARAMGIAIHLTEFELLRSEECKIRQEIEDERRRLLQNHPSEILRYLPAGVLRDSDREYLALPPEK